MKNQYLAAVIAVVISLMTIWCHASFGYTIIVGTNTLDVTFGAVSLSSNVADRIAADIGTIRSSWTNGESQVYWIGDGLDRKGHISEESRISGPYAWNCRVPFPQSITCGGGSPAIQITQDVVDAYTNAFNFVDTHVAIVSNAYVFVQFLNSNDFDELPENLLSNVVLMQDYSYFTDYLAFRADFSDQVYFAPSALSFYTDSSEHTPSAEGINICVAIPYKHGTTLDTLPAVWHDGKWKLNLWKLP